MALLDLGIEIIASLDSKLEAEVRPMFMDQDFKDRTVLHLITYNGYEQLMRDPKVTVLLDNLWAGEAAIQCDGNTSDFSLLTYMVQTPLKRLNGQNVSFRSILG